MEGVSKMIEVVQDRLSLLSERLGDFMQPVPSGRAEGVEKEEPASAARAAVRHQHRRLEAIALSLDDLMERLEV